MKSTDSVNSAWRWSVGWPTRIGIPANRAVNAASKDGASKTAVPTPSLRSRRTALQTDVTPLLPPPAGASITVSNTPMRSANSRWPGCAIPKRRTSGYAARKACTARTAIIRSPTQFGSRIRIDEWSDVPNMARKCPDGPASLKALVLIVTRRNLIASLASLCEILGPGNARTCHAHDLSTVHFTDEFQGTSRNGAHGKNDQYRVAIIAKG